MKLFFSLSSRGWREGKKTTFRPLGFLRSDLRKPSGRNVVFFPSLHPLLDTITILSFKRNFFSLSLNFFLSSFFLCSTRWRSNRWFWRMVKWSQRQSLARQRKRWRRWLCLMRRRSLKPTFGWAVLVQTDYFAWQMCMVAMLVLHRKRMRDVGHVFFCFQSLVELDFCWLFFFRHWYILLFFWMKDWEEREKKRRAFCSKPLFLYIAPLFLLLFTFSLLKSQCLELFPICSVHMLSYSCTGHLGWNTQHQRLFCKLGLLQNGSRLHGCRQVTRTPPCHSCNGSLGRMLWENDAYLHVMFGEEEAATLLVSFLLFFSFTSSPSLHSAILQMFLNHALNILSLPTAGIHFLLLSLMCLADWSRRSSRKVVCPWRTKKSTWQPGQLISYRLDSKWEHQIDKLVLWNSIPFLPLHVWMRSL